MRVESLLKASEAGDMAALRALLAEGADVNEKTSHGDTALMRAAANGHVETVRFLLDAGADVNAQAGSGMTALIRAAFFGHPAVVQALLERGADPNLRDATGMTALDWAGARGGTGVVNILKGFGAHDDEETLVGQRKGESIPAPEAYAGSRPESSGPPAAASEQGAPSRPGPGPRQTSPAEQNVAREAGAAATLTPRTGESGEEKVAGNFGGEAGPLGVDAGGREVTPGAVPARPGVAEDGRAELDPGAEVHTPPPALNREDSPRRRTSGRLKSAGLFFALTLGFAALTWVILDWMEVPLFNPGAPPPAASTAEAGAVVQADSASKEMPSRDAPPQPAPPRSDEEMLTAALGDWVAATNAKDIEKQMVFYAPRLHTYYLRRNVSSDAVRKEKVGLFGKARKVQISTGAPAIEYDGDGLAARMRFRKEYLIEAGPETRRGEVVQELFWRKTRAGWKIVGERDAEVIR